MALRNLVGVAGRYLTDNSPTLLTAFGVTGTLATAYLTGKATFRAAEIIREEQDRRNLLEPAVATVLPPLDTKQKAKLVWKVYVPPAISVVSTIGCIVSANTINTSRMAALAAAYTISDRNFTEYKDKVKETLGINKEGEIRTAVAQDAVDKRPLAGERIHNGNGGNVLCFDKWTGRYFYSDKETIRAAENDIAKGMYKGRDIATLADYYHAIGIPAPKCAEDVGWNNDVPIDLTFDSVLADGQTPCLVVDFAATPFPVRGYFGHP
jgi:hypothetical protein